MCRWSFVSCQLTFSFCPVVRKIVEAKMCQLKCRSIFQLPIKIMAICQLLLSKVIVVQDMICELTELKCMAICYNSQLEFWPFVSYQYW